MTEVADKPVELAPEKPGQAEEVANSAATDVKEDAAGKNEAANGNVEGEKSSSEGKKDPKPDRRMDRLRNPSASQRREWRENIKSEYSSLPETNDAAEIRKQVEFYFSDSNLPMDTYLYNLVGGSANKPVPIKVIHSFKRMKRFQPYSAVVEALKDSNFLDVVDGEEIKRKEPLIGRGDKDDKAYVQVYEDKTQPRSIYAKGFGEEQQSTQVDIEEFFEPYGPIRSVRLRRVFQTKLFKGSVFVEFDSEATQQQFLNLDPKPKWNGTELLIMSKKAYVDMKAEDIRQGKIKPNERRFQPGNRQGGDRQRGGSDRRNSDRRGGRDDRDWRERRDTDRRKNGFSRTCYTCGEEGHKKADCPANKEQQTERDERAKPRKSEDEFGRLERPDLEKEQDAKAGAEASAGTNETETKDAQEAKEAKSDVEATESKKRSREDDEETKENGSEAKKAKPDAADS